MSDVAGLLRHLKSRAFMFAPVGWITSSWVLVSPGQQVAGIQLLSWLSGVV